MDEAMAAAMRSLADAGPLYVLAFASVALFVWRVWPRICEWRGRREDREDRREARDAANDERRAEHEREMAELNGKWLVVSEQSAKAMEGMTSQMEVLNATLRESKERSHEMGRKVDEIHAAVVPRKGER